MTYWPDFDAPSEYEVVPVGWTDPRLPDFRVIWGVAREHGYAVGLHGSMKRDCDLIAVPWVEGASEADALVLGLTLALNAEMVGEPQDKPHGRIAVSLQVDGWVKLIDLSIIPAMQERKA